MSKRLLIAAPLVLLLGACADSFSCNKYPHGGCRSLSEVYQKSENGYTDYRRTLFDDNEDGAVHRGTPTGSNNNGTVIAQAHRALNYATPGDPMLSKPVVMRILYTPVEDKNGAVDGGGYVFIKVKDSEWILQN